MNSSKKVAFNVGRSTSKNPLIQDYSIAVRITFDVDDNQNLYEELQQYLIDLKISQKIFYKDMTTMSVYEFALYVQSRTTIVMLLAFLNTKQILLVNSIYDRNIDPHFDSKQLKKIKKIQNYNVLRPKAIPHE